jgi:hypothetical protein
MSEIPWGIVAVILSMGLAFSMAAIALSIADYIDRKDPNR